MCSLLIIRRDCGADHLPFGLQVATITALAAAPWMVKPLYGFLSDTLPIFGYRRRSYLIVCGLLGKTYLCK